MTRFAVKNNRVIMGWEGAFRFLNGTSEEVAIITDAEFVLHMESISVDEIKPQMERLPKWYVNNSTRKNSHTYDSDFKVGSGSLSGDFKHGHLLDAVMGGVTVTDQTTYDEARIAGGDRSSLFVHFNHGAKRAKQMIGVTVGELTINTSEGEIVTFNASVMSAKILDAPPITGDLSAMIDTNTPPFHWKHVKICISFDGMASSYNTLTRNYVESAKVTIKNETEYKNGAQSETTSENPNYYIEKKFEVEVEVTLYPDDEVIWLFAPSESEYNDYGTKGTLHYENLAVGVFVVGETVTGATSGETGIVVANWDSNKLFIRNKSGAFESGEQIEGGTSGATADIVVAYQEFGLSIEDGSGASGLTAITNYEFMVNEKHYTITTPVPYQELGLNIVGGDSSGLAGATTYNFYVNLVPYSITTIAALTYNDIIALMNTSLNAGDMDCTLEGTDIRITAQSDGPTSISITDGLAPKLLDTLTGFTAVDTAVNSTSYNNVITLIDTALNADDMVCTLNTGDIRITSDTGAVLPPDRVSISSGMGNDLLDALTGFTVVDNPVGGFINGHISFKLTLERSTNDLIEIYSKNLQLDPISEVLENIEQGVDPLTFTGKLARSISDIDIWIKSLLHDNSFSVKY